MSIRMSLPSFYILSKFWFKQKTWPLGTITTLCLFSGKHHILLLEFSEHGAFTRILSSYGIITGRDLNGVAVACGYMWYVYFLYSWHALLSYWIWLSKHKVWDKIINNFKTVSIKLSARPYRTSDPVWTHKLHICEASPVGGANMWSQNFL